MKKYLILTSFLALCAMQGLAQPKFVSKVKKGIVSVNTYDEKGNLLRQGTAFYIGENGDAVADYRLFKGAYKALVTDASGKQDSVVCISGADDTYSLVRFQVDAKKHAVLPSVTEISPISSELFVLSVADGKVLHVQATVADTSFIQGKYAYYGLSKKIDDKLIGQPVFNKDGALAGVLHSTIGEQSYVLDIRFV